MSVDLRAWKDLYALDCRMAVFGERTYPLCYGKDVLKHLGTIMRDTGLQQKTVAVTQPPIKDLFGSRLERALADVVDFAGWITFPAGESHKNLDTVATIYGACATFGVEKGTALIALGGGVVQDVGNYVAATYLRGIPLVQVPTTLLSQADIGIGGCAIDHPQGKSLIGTFYQPRLVLEDSALLETLPKDEISCGLSEIINKVICLGGGDIDEMVQDVAKIRAGSPGLLQNYIRRSNDVKINIIEQDETGARGLRVLLDWGHTIAHALERALSYSVSHGWALGIGMRGEAVLSHRLGYLDWKSVEQISLLIDRAGLPTTLPPSVKDDDLLRCLGADQKTLGGRPRFVLLRCFGDAFLSAPVHESDVRACLASLHFSRGCESLL